MIRFMNANDISREYQISIATARRHMSKMKELFSIDEKRLPKKGLMPKNIVKKYFTVDEKIVHGEVDDK